jgi:hypothetical protein
MVPGASSKYSDRPGDGGDDRRRVAGVGVGEVAACGRIEHGVNDGGERVG